VLDARGPAPAAICRAADEARASLVLLGSRGVGGARALGSVSERVAHEARCSVLVVRPRAAR
jgi:nucleotide-binding universal stress UspA family protein